MDQSASGASTAAVADACLRLGVPLGVMPPLKATMPQRISGPGVPARHAGSVDVFLEALQPHRGGILVVDNHGRMDEGCVGDLTAQACRDVGVQAMVVWGCHRDTADLARMGFPVWSLGSCPAGPRAARARAADALDQAWVGDCVVSKGDWVVLDDDGGIAVPGKERQRVEAVARTIMQTEARQARLAREGTPLARQFDLEGYLAARRVDPSLTFREHLGRIGAAIEV